MTKYTLFPLNNKPQVIDADSNSIFNSIDTTTIYGTNSIAELFTEFYLLDNSTWYVIAEPMGNSSILYLVEDYDEYDAVMQVVGEGEYDGIPPVCIGTVSKVETVDIIG